MSHQNEGQHRRRRAPPHLGAVWPAALGVAIAALAYAVLPDQLREGPRWLVPALALTLMVLAAGARWRGYHELAPWISRTLAVVVTAALVASVALLVSTLPGSRTTGRELLSYAALLWVLNVLVFALWYWEIDGGGPHVRHPGIYGMADFVFPQFQQDPDNAASYWMPGFFDYVFLAFNTSTAFSPTDTLVMSSRAKALMMSQAVISLIVITILTARAISLL